MFLLVSGSGDFFTSGIDLANFAEVPSMNEDEQRLFADEKYQIIERSFESVIRFRKPLVLLANGPAIGFGATLLG